MEGWQIWTESSAARAIFDMDLRARPSALFRRRE